MRRIKILYIAGLVITWAFAAPCLADVSFGLSVGEEGLRSFYLAIGEHYQVPEKQIVAAREKKIPDEEMPVVFFLARRADIDPSLIIKMRLGGKSWMDICLHFGLTAEVFYVPLKGNPGPPYGKAYGHYKKHKKDQWREIRLTDVDIVNLVNLRFISNHYGCPPDEIIKLRGSGSSFADINAKMKKAKLEKTANPKQLSTSEGPKKKAAGKKGQKKK